MAKVKINKSRCKGCYLCIVNCPNGLIKIAAEMNVKGVRPVIFSRGKPARPKGDSKWAGGCTGCAMCAYICPECIIEVYK